MLCGMLRYGNGAWQLAELLLCLLNAAESSRDCQEQTQLPISCLSVSITTTQALEHGRSYDSA